MEEHVTTLLKRGPKSARALQQELGIIGEKIDPTLTATLRRLERQGKIMRVKRRWVVTTMSVCPTCQGKGWVSATKAAAAPSKKPKADAPKKTKASGNK